MSVELPHYYIQPLMPYNMLNIDIFLLYIYYRWAGIDQSV